MKYFLLEGHRPGANWEKQTRIIEAPSFHEACAAAEKMGIVLQSAQAMSPDFEPSHFQRANPFLFTPWNTVVSPVS